MILNYIANRNFRNSLGFISLIWIYNGGRIKNCKYKIYKYFIHVYELYTKLLLINIYTNYCTHLQLEIIYL